MSEVIPAEAVEAAARWLYARNEEYGKPSWEDAASDLVWNTLRGDCMDEARELLEAAAPHIMAQVWDEGHEEGWLNHESGLTEPQGRKRNPYRPPA